MTSPVVKKSIKDMVESIKELPRDEKIEFFKYLKYRCDIDYWVTLASNNKQQISTNIFSTIELYKIKNESTPFDYELKINHYRRSKYKDYEPSIYSERTVRLLKSDLDKLCEIIKKNDY